MVSTFLRTLEKIEDTPKSGSRAVPQTFGEVRLYSEDATCLLQDVDFACLEASRHRSGLSN